MATHPITTDIYDKVMEFVCEHRRFALAVVMKDAGSTPRKAGTKAIIDEEGSIWGTIGGGLLESDARKAAIDAMKSNRPRIFDFKFSGASAGDDDPVCGGNMRILIDPTIGGQNKTRDYAAAADALKHRWRGVFVTMVFHDSAIYTRAEYFRTLKQDGPPEIAQIVARTAAPHYWTESGKLPIEALAEPVVPRPRLLVSGGGHVGQALARAAQLAGFEVVVIEDREEFSDPSLFGEQIQCRRGAFGEALEEFPIDEDTYVALVGRGHKVDGKALRACLNSPAAYIGMMGSRRKVALVKKDFIENGLCDEEGWKKIHAPIGLDIGAETVPEIAASVVAQLVAVRRKKDLS